MGIEQKNILYLPILRVQLDKILAKIKEYEFRSFSDHYLGKLLYSKNGEYTDEKPLTHILFQVTKSMRVLIEMPDWGFIDDSIDNEDDERTKAVLAAAEKEGFEKGDSFIAFKLGKILHREGI